jgi:hypothetical protein
MPDLMPGMDEESRHKSRNDADFRDEAQNHQRTWQPTGWPCAMPAIKVRFAEV